MSSIILIKRFNRLHKRTVKAIPVNEVPAPVTRKAAIPANTPSKTRPVKVIGSVPNQPIIKTAKKSVPELNKARIISPVFNEPPAKNGAKSLTRIIFGWEEGFVLHNQVLYFLDGNIKRFEKRTAKMEREREKGVKKEQ